VACCLSATGATARDPIPTELVSVARCLTATGATARATHPRRACLGGLLPDGYRREHTAAPLAPPDRTRRADASTLARAQDAWSALADIPSPHRACLGGLLPDSYRRNITAAPPMNWT
jgi:hypothetical protein